MTSEAKSEESAAVGEGRGLLQRCGARAEESVLLKPPEKTAVLTAADALIFPSAWVENPDGSDRDTRTPLLQDLARRFSVDVIAATTEAVVFADRLSVSGFTRKPKWQATSAIRKPNTAPLASPM